MLSIEIDRRFKIIAISIFLVTCVAFSLPPQWLEETGGAENLFVL